MKFDTYSIYDSKADVHSRPLIVVNLPSFERELMKAVTDERSPYSQYPADFTLFLLGSYNDHTAAFDLLPSKIAVYNLAEFKARIQVNAAGVPDICDEV